MLYNAAMFALKKRSWHRLLVLGLALALVIPACSRLGPGEVNDAAASATPSPALTPYWTPTPSRTPTSIASPGPATPQAQAPTIPPPPTPTPFTVEVKSGDTLLAIAFRHGITLEELQAANPDVDPGFLSIGTRLVIPIGEETPNVIPSPTPAPVTLGEPQCYSAPDGMWCLVPANNDQQQVLENLSAWVRLYSPEGEALAGKAAIPPLNILPPDTTLPLVVFFDEPDEVGQSLEVTPEAELLTAFTVPEEDGRYLQTRLLTVEQTAPEDQAGYELGQYATLQGWVDLPPSSPGAALVWLAAVAYNAAGEIVGVRKWEAETPLSPGASLPFEITVYSLGPPIDRVEVLVEAREPPP